MNDVYFVDLDFINSVFFQNLHYLIKMLIILSIFFYFLPNWLFPQPFKKFSIKKIIYNLVLMVAYVETFVTLLIFLKIFSLPLFFILLIVTKIAFLKFYYKQDIGNIINEFKIRSFSIISDILDTPGIIKNTLKEKIVNTLLKLQEKISIYNVLKFLLYSFVVIYIVITFSLRGLYSVADPIPDTAQFIEWVTHLKENILYADYQMGADFYGISILIFFIHIITNIDVVVLFAIYPIFLIIMLYLSIYFVIKDFTNNEYIALLSVVFHSIVLMSPVADYFLGSYVVTTTPNVIKLFNFKIYWPTHEQILTSVHFPFESYYRYITGMAYEHASVFVLLNAYFFLKATITKLFRYIILYGLTLYLVFVFHGAGAIPLLIITLIMMFLSIFFRKLDWITFKKGIIAVILAIIFGNMWMLSVLKFGIPKDFGAAAPFLDKIFNTQTNVKEIMKEGFSIVKYLYVTKIGFVFIFLLFLDFIVSIFSKKRFNFLMFLSIPAGIYIVYFGPNLGLPVLTEYLRLSEYLFLADTLLVGFNLYLFYKLIKSKFIWLSFSYFIIFALVLIVPKWFENKLFYKILNFTQWNSDAEFIVKVAKKERNYSWTIVSYVADYPKIKDKGFHINTNSFILKYSPTDKYLKIPTKKIFIVVEDIINPYKGLNEWFYRWKRHIQSAIKSWIAIYSQHHKNIKLIYRTKTISVYEIDNSEYVRLLERKNARSKLLH